MAWKGHKAKGPQEMGMSVLKGDETPTQIIRIAYSHEQGLAVFYVKMVSVISDEKTAGLFNLLADIEEHHKQKLFDLYKNIEPSAERESFEKQISADVMEGGWTIEEFIRQYQSTIEKPADAVNIAMMIEAQALDLYLRYAGKSKDENVKKVLFNLADEEKAHLKRLGSLMDKIENVH
jgi:rubrerythrin